MIVEIVLSLLGKFTGDWDKDGRVLTLMGWRGVDEDVNDDGRIGSVDSIWC